MSDIAHPLWIEPWPLILASASKARAEMLRAAGIPVEVVASDIDERAVEAPFLERRAPAEEIATALAEAKALSVSARYPRRLVLGGDQVLSIGSELLSKPKSLLEARRQLLRMRDGSHSLHSAAVLAVDGRPLDRIVSSANLWVRPFSEEFLDRYLGVTADHATLSVGSYRLEVEGVHLFERIEGDHFTILGLPLVGLLEVLRRRGMVAA